MIPKKQGSIPGSSDSLTHFPFYNLLPFTEQRLFSIPLKITFSHCILFLDPEDGSISPAAQNFLLADWMNKCPSAFKSSVAEQLSFDLPNMAVLKEKLHKMKWCYSVAVRLNLAPRARMHDFVCIKHYDFETSRDKITVQIRSSIMHCVPYINSEGPKHSNALNHIMYYTKKNYCP